MAPRGARLALSALALACRASQAIVHDFPKRGHLPPVYMPPAAFPAAPPAGYMPPAALTATQHKPGYFKELAANKTACTCRNWAGVYGRGDVKCGSGEELFTYGGGVSTRRAVPNFMRVTDDTFCNDAFGKPSSAFFPKQYHNLCVRRSRFDAHGHESGSWCYVSKTCEGEGVYPAEGTPLKVKICKPLESPALGDLQPAALFDIARKQSTDYRIMAQMAYKPSAAAWDEGSRLAALRQMASWRGTQWFPAAGGAVKVAYQDQLWHVFPEADKHPVCTEGCK